MSGKVKLQYFKASGKYYSEGEYDTSLEDWEVYAEVKTMLRLGTLPGLRDGCVEFDVLVLPPCGVPGFIKANHQTLR